ncbi:MAG: sulfur carrier protein ThiS [Planctomycetota bacterium]
MIRIIVDDLAREVPSGTTVGGVLRMFGESRKHALVEVNGVYVHAKDYDVHILQSGDHVEVIYPAFGG